MNVADFTYLIERPEKVAQHQLSSIGSIIEEYPFFQSARALYLKGLKELDSFKYNSFLKETAAHTADRAILFDFITSRKFHQNDIAQSLIKQNSQLKDIEVDAEEVIGRYFMEREKAITGFEENEADAVLDPELFQRKQVEKQLSIGKPLDFNQSEKHSFAEWLQLSSFEPIERDGKFSEPEGKTPLDKKLDLIDKFIENNPKIGAVRDIHPSFGVNLAKEKEIEKTELMTETLARVYLEQKKYKKAIQAYKILSLKYPEKSGFFADQINAIKKLQQHN